MSLIGIMIMVQTVSSTLAWVGFYVGIRALPGATARQSRWIIGSVVVAAVWLLGVLLLGGVGNHVPPLLIPAPLGGTLLAGYFLLLSPTFRRIIAAVPQHWLIGIQVFRTWELCGWSAISRANCSVCSRCRRASATSRPGCLRPSLLMRGIAASPTRAAPRSRGTSLGWLIS